MKKGWEIMRLVDVCIVERGSSPRPIKKYLTDDEDGVNWIKIGDTKNIEKYIYKTNQKITKEGAKKSRFVDEGDFILSNSMSYGKPYIVKTQGYIHDGWFKLKLYDFVDTEYFYQLLSSPYVNEQFKSLASGSVVKNISGDLVKKVVLPIPPLKTQQQIVNILDKAFTAIDQAKANAQQNLQNAKELFESYLQNVFENKGDDWEESLLNDNVKFIDYRGRTPKKTPFGIKLITAKNIKKGYLQTKPEEFIAEEDYDSWMSRGIPRYNDVIFTTEAPLANVAQLNTKEKVAFAQRTIVFQPNLEIINQTFLKYLILSKPYQKDIISQGTGATVKGIKSSLLKKIKISYPKSIKEQQKIVEQLDKLQTQTKKLESIYTQKIADLEELKKSVLQKAFNGELIN